MKTASKLQTTSSPIQEQTGPIVRTHQTWSPGDVAHQGDLIFVCLPSLPDASNPRINRQLVDGGTIGSRHVLVGGSLYDCSLGDIATAVAMVTKGKMQVGRQYVGPVFAGPATVTHPQHQDQEFPADTITACVYQRNLDSDEREHRAMD
jgi:hypothetical protein